MQQSNLSVFNNDVNLDEWISWLTIAWKIFGYQEYTLKILFNLLMSLLDQFVAFSLRGGGERLGLGKS